MWTVLVSLAWGQAVDFSCTPSNAAGKVLAEPPVEVSCDLVVDALYDFAQARWIMGDGTSLTGSSVRHTYDTPGQYDVHVYLDDFGYAIDTGAPLVEGEEVKRGFVTVCDTPQAQFTYVFKGGLSYQMVNTSVFIPDCLDVLQWTVYDGEGRGGSVVEQAAGWEPRFELPEEGTYTIVLEVGGVAGATAATLTVDAEGGLSDEFANGSQACATGPNGAAAVFWGLPLLVLGWGRRRSAL